MNVRLYSCLTHPACKAHAPYYNVICGLSGSTVFLNIISKKGRFIFLKKGKQKMYVLFFLKKFFLKNFVLRMNSPKYYYTCRQVLIIKPTRRTKFSNLFLESDSTCFRVYLCPSSEV